MRLHLRERLSDLLDMIRSGFFRIISSRVTLLLTVLMLLFTIIGGRLFYLQIIKADYYTQNFTQKTQRTITVDAARGNIYDRNGNILAYNEIAYSVSMTDEIPSSRERGDILNGIAYRTVQIIEKHGDHIINDFNIEIDEHGEYAFKKEPKTRPITFLINVFGVKSDEVYAKGYDKYTAAEIMEFICGDKKFAISYDYTPEERLKIATVRYMLSLNSYQKYVSTVIAENVCEETKAAILEAEADLIGVEITENYKRVYNDAEYFAHLLGYTGQISEDELEEFNAGNAAGIVYESGDIVGKSGLEMSFDSFLQGTKGTRTVFVDSMGNILDVIEEVKSDSGNDLHLTIDRDLQIAAYTILEKKLAACLINKIVNYNYEAKEKQTYVYIPINDVYDKILTNIIDVTAFNRDGASMREKDTYAFFQARREEVLGKIELELRTTETTPVNQLTTEFNDYMYFIYDLLGIDGALNKSLINTKNPVYDAWTKEEVSLREFLQEAIVQNWINVGEIDSDEQYSNSEEIYDSIVNTAMELLKNSRKFDEKIYYYMIYDGSIDPYDICLMMYDQGILEEDRAYERLVNREIDTFTYVKNQIESLVLTPAMLALDPCSGSMCITDTNSGKVLALVSYPSYDNNRLSGRVDSDYWYELNNNDSQPLFHYATQALTAPGSTFKLCTSVAGLAEGFITPQTRIMDEVVFDEISPSPRCYIAPYSHGEVNVSEALEVSCNYFFFQIGYEMGLDENGDYYSVQALDTIERYARALGLGIKSGVELSERDPRVSTTDSVRTSIGQGTNGYATVHMARYVNTIANSGRNYQLSLVDSVTDKKGDTIVKYEPVLTNTVDLPAEDWNAIHYGMRLVTQSGTASTFFTNLHSVNVAAKTGTAEEDAYRSNHTAFVGYAPYESPEISFACMIRNSDSTSYPGGVVCDTLRYYYGELTLAQVMRMPVSNDISGFHSE